MTRLMFAWAMTGLLFAAATARSATAADAILINFTSSHCMPCQAMKPVLGQLEQSGVPVRHVDVDVEPSVAQRYGIRKTPTFVVISGGKEVTRLVGGQPIEQLQRALATDPTGPLFATNSKQNSVDNIPAPQTRLAPMGGSNFDSANSANIGATPQYAQAAQYAQTEPAQLASSQSGDAYSEAMPSMSVADAIQRAQAATVRLRVHDGNGYGAGTGTIIDTHGDDALVLTCGHLFRDNDGKGKVEVDLFVGGQVRTVIGQVIDYDAESRDIALVAIQPGFAVQPVEILPASESARSGQTAFSFGCDRGDDPSRRDTRITGVNKYNQHLGSSNIEIDGAPIDGRSGGGLFDDAGRLVGVCNAADYKNDVGIYTGPGSVQWQLDRVNLSHLYQSDSNASQPVDHIAAVAPPVNQAAFNQLAGDQEVIVIVRDRNDPAGTSQVMTLSQPTADLMQMIQRHAR